MCSAAEIWSALRLCWPPSFLGGVTAAGALRSSSHGGALSSQGESAGTPVGETVSPWHPCQVRVPAAGAAKCSRQYDSNLVRSEGDAKGPCVALRPQFEKQPERSHHASRIRGRRTTILANSESGLGFAILGTGARDGSVSADTVVLAVDTVPVLVGTALGPIVIVATLAA